MLACLLHTPSPTLATSRTSGCLHPPSGVGCSPLGGLEVVHPFPFTSWELQDKVKTLSTAGDVPLKNANGSADSLTEWFRSTLDYELEMNDVEQLEKEDLERRLESIVEDHFHPEIR